MGTVWCADLANRTPAITATRTARSRPRCGMKVAEQPLDAPRPHLLLEVVHRPTAHGQDGPGRVLGTAGHEGGGVRDIDVRYVVQAAPAVGHRRLRIVAHARGPDLVDGPA